jgi:hypothetical protein
MRIPTLLNLGCFLGKVGLLNRMIRGAGVGAAAYGATAHDFPSVGCDDAQSRSIRPIAKRSAFSAYYKTCKLESINIGEHLPVMQKIGITHGSELTGTGRNVSQ